MGSASTIACLTETLGLMLPGGASPTSGSGDRLRNAVASGRAAVNLARNPIRPREILTKPAFENALKVHQLGKEHLDPSIYPPLDVLTLGVDAIDATI